MRWHVDCDHHKCNRVHAVLTASGSTLKHQYMMLSCAHTATNYDGASLNTDTHFDVYTTYVHCHLRYGVIQTMTSGTRVARQSLH
jgi:hypothetical protein